MIVFDGGVAEEDFWCDCYSRLKKYVEGVVHAEEVLGRGCLGNVG